MKFLIPIVLFSLLGFLLIPTLETNTLQNSAFGQNEITVEGYLNILHGHLEDGTPLYEYHLLDFDTFTKLPIILELPTPISFKEIFELAGNNVVVNGIITENSTSFKRMQVVSIKPTGAIIELNQKVYSWTDKVSISIYAPIFNVDPTIKDVIGGITPNPLKISTRGSDLDDYSLVESDIDSGLFVGEIILTGFGFDADGNTNTGDGHGFDTFPQTLGNGPKDGFLEADDDDGITVSFEYYQDETVVGSALIRWNIGVVQWLADEYRATGTGVVRVMDPDMNLNPEAIDNIDLDVWSDSDAGGIDLTVTETDEASGIFVGTVFFTLTDESSGQRLRVAEGDTITVEYEDNTLPDPYTIADELDITDTAIIDSNSVLFENPNSSNIDDNIIRLVYQESGDSFGIHRIDHGLAHDDSLIVSNGDRVNPEGAGAPDGFSSRVIPIKFRDLNHESKEKNELENIFFASDDSLSSYWLSNSYRNFHLQGSVLDWTLLENQKGHYQYPNGSLKPWTLMKDVIDAVDTRINFNGSDGAKQNSGAGNLRGDGDKGDDIDQLIFIVTQDVSDQSPLLEPLARSYIRPYAIQTDEGEHWIFPIFIVDGGSGFPIGRDFQKGYGAVAHEMGHNFIWYHTPLFRPHDTYDDPWSLLSGRNDNVSPPGVVSFQQKKAHWIDPQENIIQVPPGHSTLTTLNYLTRDSSYGNLMIEIPFGTEDNFYTVEARKDSGSDHVPNPPGLMIYHFNPDGHGDNIMRSLGEDRTAPLSAVAANRIVCEEENERGFCLEANYQDLSLKLGQTYVDQSNNIRLKLISESEDSVTVCISNDGDPAVPKILINPSNTGINDSMNLDIEFRDCFDALIQDVRYSLSVRQNGVYLLQVNNESDSDGVVNHRTNPLPFDASSSKPVYVNVEFHSTNDFTQTVVTENIQVVPEFDSVAIVVLLISIFTVIAMTSKSRLSMVGIFR